MKEEFSNNELSEEKEQDPQNNEFSDEGKQVLQINEIPNIEISDVQESTVKTSGIIKYKKRLLLIIPIIAVLVVVLIAVSITKSNRDSDSSSDGYVSTYDPYVEMVKGAENSTYGITYEDAFENFFSDTDWDSFTATDGEKVVEFEGKCYQNDTQVELKVQFLLDLSEGTFQTYYMSVDDESVSQLEMAVVISKIFSSYYD